MPTHTTAGTGILFPLSDQKFDYIRSLVAPTATVFNNKIYVAYTVDGDYLKVAWNDMFLGESGRRQASARKEAGRHRR